MMGWITSDLAPGRYKSFSSIQTGSGANPARAWYWPPTST